MYTFIHICTYIYSYITPFKTLHKYNATSLYNSKYSKNKICTCIHTCRYIYSIVQNIYNATLLQLYVNPHSKCGQIMSRVHETDMLLRLRTRSMPVLTQNYSRSFVWVHTHMDTWSGETGDKVSDSTHKHKHTHSQEHTQNVDSTHTHTQIQHAGKSHTYTYTNRHSHIHTHTPPHTPARVLIYAAIDTCHTTPPPHTHIPAGVLMYAVIATCHPPHTYTHTHTHTHAHLLGSWCTLGLLLVAVEGSTATSLFCVTYQTQLWCIYIYTYINKFMYVDRCIYICRYMCSHTDIDRYSYVCI